MEELIGTTTILRTGHSYRITIPVKIIRELNLQPGQKLLVYLDKEKKRIVLKTPE